VLLSNASLSGYDLAPKMEEVNIVVALDRLGDRQRHVSAGNALNLHMVATPAQSAGMMGEMTMGPGGIPFMIRLQQSGQ